MNKTVVFIIALLCASATVHAVDRRGEVDRSLSIMVTSVAERRPVDGVAMVDGQGVALGVTNAEGRIVVERSQEWWGTVRPMHRDFVFQPANVLVQGIAKDGTVLAFEARPAESAIPAFAVRFVDKRFKVYRGAASHDDGSLRVEFDFHCPRLLGLVVDHVFPVFFRYQVLKIGGTAVRPPVEDPEDSAVFFFGTRLERNGYTDPS